MATGASVESRLKTGLDHGLHTHYGSATARMASHMKTVTIGMYHIHPLLVTAGVQGNCVIGREVCEKVYGRVFDPSCKRRETQWGYDERGQVRKYVCLYCTKSISGVRNGTDDARVTFLRHAAKCNMAQCKALMTADDFHNLDKAITSIVQAQSASDDLSFRDMLIDNTATLNRLEAGLHGMKDDVSSTRQHTDELLLNKRKLEAGDERLEEAKRMSTEARALHDQAQVMNGQAHRREDAVALREEASWRERAELHRKAAELDRKQAELDTKKAELDEQAQRGTVRCVF